MSEPRKPERQWFQFRLRTLLIVVLLLSLPLSWFGAEVRRAKQQRMTAKAFQRLGCEVLLDRGSLAAVLGIPESLAGFPDWVVARNVPLTDSDLRHFRELPEIRGIQLNDTDITDAGLRYLSDSTNLITLHLSNTHITDAGLKHLKRLTNLRHLMLDGTLVTDAGMEHLLVLTKLRSLVLCHTGVSDTGIERLKGLSDLEMVVVGDSVTQAGIEKLEQALPNCRVTRFEDDN